MRKGGFMNEIKKQVDKKKIGDKEEEI